MVIAITSIWIILGFLNVYLAGVIDRKINAPETAPIYLLFILGPIGTATCVVMYSIHLIVFIYKLGSKKGE